MRYRDKETGAVLEPRSETVAAAFASNPRYEEYKQSPVGEKPVSQMSKAELLAKAASLGIVVPEGATNADLQGLIKAVQDGQDAK